jgi:hypothetical protein
MFIILGTTVIQRTYFQQSHIFNTVNVWIQLMSAPIHILTSESAIFLLATC